MKTITRRPAPYLPKIRLSLLNEAQALYDRLIDRINDDSLPTDDRLGRLAEAAANRVNRRLSALAESGAMVRLGWHFVVLAPGQVIDDATAVLNDNLFRLNCRLRDFDRDHRNTPAEVREGIEEHRSFVQAEFERIERIRDRLGELRYTLAWETRPRECEWREDWDAWATSCRHMFEFTDGTPEDNHMKYCPFCGGILRPVFDRAESEAER